MNFESGLYIDILKNFVRNESALVKRKEKRFIIESVSFTTE